MNIPNSVTSIGDYTFYECTSLESINIPNSVTKIGKCAFRSCNAIKNFNIEGKNFFTKNGLLISSEGVLIHCFSTEPNIIIPGSVTSIGDRAFFECESLKSINIPNSVTSIDEAAFEGCHAIKSFNIEGKNFFTENGLLISSKGVLIHCFSTEPDIYIPDSVTSIGVSAFKRCESLKSINIPNTVTSIGNEAFLYCKSLKSIYIPNSVTSIGYYTFYECSNLISIYIPKGTKEKFSKMLCFHTDYLVENDI